MAAASVIFFDRIRRATTFFVQDMSVSGYGEAKRAVRKGGAVGDFFAHRSRWGNALCRTVDRSLEAK